MLRIFCFSIRYNADADDDDSDGHKRTRPSTTRVKDNTRDQQISHGRALCAQQLANYDELERTG